MKKYIAKLLFNVNSNQTAQSAEFDEQIRLVESASLEGAFYKARSIGKREEGTVVDARNNHYHWQFIDVSEVYPIEGLKDGDQLYSNTHTIQDSDSFIHYIKQKSMELQVKTLTFA